MDTFLSQMQQFSQGVAQLWQEQLGRWERATEAGFAAQRVWLEQWHDLFARWRGTESPSPGPRGA
jgi:hypothetical protein